MANPIVTIEMNNGKVMKAELYPEIAPNTVNNFISLVQSGFYDDLTFHRVIYGFAGSQFFIMHKAAPHLDGQYAAFGKIIEGMEVVDEIAGCDTDFSDKPLDPQIIEKMTVETFGEDYPAPEKM